MRILSFLLTVKRSGAVEARRAHNPDVPGSKPGCAIFFEGILFFY